MHNYQPDLSLIISSDKEFLKWDELIISVRNLLTRLNLTYEVLIVKTKPAQRSLFPNDETIRTVICNPDTPYGVLLRTAFERCRGEYIVTMEAEESFASDFLFNIWNARGLAEILIGSRYIKGGSAKLPFFRKVSSRLLNLVFSRGLDLRILDMSSAFRLYHSQVLKNIDIKCADFDILQEILVKALMMGYQIAEVPLKYQSGDAAYSRAARFARAYINTFVTLWKQRNSIASGDYDARAFDAFMPPQRYWQRKRYKIVSSLLHKDGLQKCLDVGCGSSRMINLLPPGSVALDILRHKLRYAKRFGRSVIQGSIFALPVPSESFPCILCSQVIEHVARANVLDELDRVLKPGGFLILGTPDYANWEWRVIEWLYKVLLPQAYADEHISHYTYQELIHSFVNERDYRLEATEYILNGELILGLRKPAS